MPLTVSDYSALPEDGQRYELIEGELVMTPSPSFEHQWVVLELTAIFREHVRHHQLGVVVISPFDVVLSQTTVVQPDIIYVAREHHGRIGKRGVQGPPTLVIEVLSPSRPSHDRVLERRTYRENRVPHFWIVDWEKRTLEGLALGRDEYSTEAMFTGNDMATLSPFPNLVIPLNEIWPPELQE